MLRQWKFLVMYGFGTTTRVVAVISHHRMGCNQRFFGADFEMVTRDVTARVPKQLCRILLHFVQANITRKRITAGLSQRRSSGQTKRMRGLQEVFYRAAATRLPYFQARECSFACTACYGNRLLCLSNYHLLQEFRRWRLPSCA